MTHGRISPQSPILAESEAFLALIDATFDGIAIWAAAPWRIEHANAAFWQLVGGPGAAIGPKPATNLASVGLQMRIAELLDRFSELSSGASTVSTRLETGAGHTPIEARLCHIAHDGRRLVGMIVRAITGEPSIVGGTCDATRRDPLTGLPDREFLMARLANLLEGERAADRHFAVVFLDLDNFKQVNDEFGHLIGDNVLHEAGRRIAGCLRDGDHLVRYGGDEFVALIHGVTTACDVEPVVGRVHLALSTPIGIPGGEVSLSLSAGIALASEAGSSPEELLAAADRAMYVAKRLVV
jgi:diguanylate cyclase (GGDEF)-like protein